MLKISRLIAYGLLTFLVTLTVPRDVTADEQVSVLIRDIAVLEPSAAGWLMHRDIVIRNTTVSVIQPTGGTLPAAKVVINGQGKFAIPGLFDNRVSIARMSRETAGLFVAYGVTSVRDSDNDSPRVVEWRREIANGKLMGPRLVDDTGVIAQSVPLPGSNAGAAAIVPGDALHDELIRLVSGGATPAEALRRATLESARFHGRSKDLGSIEVGKIADVVVLTADPLVDISRTRDIDAVVFRGETLTRAHLNLLLSKSRSSAAGRSRE